MDRIELDNLTRTYYDAQGETFCALDHAALIWEQGHSIAIMGESGSGKSTLARLMIGLERPSEGRILINGVDTTKWSLREWRKYRGKIQAVFQDAGGTLNPAWSTSKNVEEALVNLTDLSPSQRKNRIAELMEQTGLFATANRIFKNPLPYGSRSWSVTPVWCSKSRKRARNA